MPWSSTWISGAELALESQRWPAAAESVSHRQSSPVTKIASSYDDAVLLMASRSFARIKKRNARVIAVVVVALVVFVSTFASLRLSNQVWAPSQDDNSAPTRPSLHVVPHKQKPQNSTLAQHNPVINVPLGVEHYFWRGRQNGLVKLIKKVKQTHRHSNATILLNLTIRCKRLYDELHLGTGNLVLGFYAMRLAATTAQVDYTFQCIQSPEAALKARTQGSILSWLQGYYAAPKNPTTFSPYDPPLPTLNEAARGMGRIPLYYMSEAIRHDLRNMALQVVGPRRQNETINTTDPLYPNADIDDVAIHFRCGDIMKGFNSDAYGIVAFDSYRRYISSSAKTIGIVTASFDENALRSRDRGTTRACHVLVNALVEYLHFVFPNATIYIRNDGFNETLAMAFARLVMANQTLISPSTFSIFPAIASFGTSYIQRANLTYFVAPIVQHYENVQYMDGPLLSAIDVFYYHSHVSNETRRITLMLDWLMQPTCRVRYLKASSATTVLVCGETNGTTVTRATDMIRLGT